MRGLFANPSLTIPAGEAASGVAVRSETLRVRSGRVWITVEGQSHDYWLHAGDSFTAAPGRQIVVEADRDDSRLDLVPTIQWSTMLKLLARDLVQRFTRSGHVVVQRCSRNLSNVRNEVRSIP
ncbi:DUF2917 domain-containing protein [Noviherbaspirillum galbum]|uniref:DUF2917 domain-containing protein n=1 Tax=Noviherbaspirillum galbum TaxID=2709383 RepID=A0A6B3SRJ0_9BURK|nr:DUF2917 domain-containing protein [Noviherbaspirillum galbum]NEX61396.1 DUF2917 domain-containing protein [Noviherbaspirillum galbum]